MLTSEECIAAQRIFAKRLQEWVINQAAATGGLEGVLAKIGREALPPERIDSMADPSDVSELLSVRAFADASFLDCPDTARSTGGYCVFFCGNLIAFESKRLPLVTLSTAESEYVEATRCATEVAYIKELCRDFNIDLDTVPIMEDNTACIAISANPVHHQRTKHIAKYYHYCRDLVLAG